MNQTHAGATRLETHHDGDDEAASSQDGTASVEVRRNGAVAAGVASVAGLVAAAYLARAASTGGLLDWAVFVLMGALALAYVRSWLDARTPLLVADATGIRMRLGRAWHGLPWEDLEEVEHAPRQGLLRDGRLVAFPLDPDASMAALEPRARRQAAIAQRVHGAPFALPLGLTTTVTGADDGLTRALLALAPDPELVVEVVPGLAEEGPVEPHEQPVDETDTTPAPAQESEPGTEPGTESDAHPEPTDTTPRPSPWRRAADAARTVRDTQLPRVAARRERSEASEHDGAAHGEVVGHEDLGDPGDTAIRPRPLVPTTTPSPSREPSRAVRADVTRQSPAQPQVSTPVLVSSSLPAMPSAAELDRQATGYFASGPDDTGVWRSTTEVIDELAGPAHDPVIGPRLTEAREALDLSVEQLAARTRIRAHVIEAVEVDDFGPCGGDFYARGHLRTLARVLNVDAAPLLAAYDERYAAAPIEARRVFEAELSTGAGGSIRSLRGGPNWSVIVAAVMAVVLAWSVARLVMDQPQDSAGDAPSLSSGSAGLTSGTTDLPPAVPVVLRAEGGGAKVVVRDGAGEVLFKGDLAFGQSRTVKVSPPIRVQTSDGSLTVAVDGQDPETMGLAGRVARDTFVP